MIVFLKATLITFIVILACWGLLVFILKIFEADKKINEAAVGIENDELTVEEREMIDARSK